MALDLAGAWDAWSREKASVQRSLERAHAAISAPDQPQVSPAAAPQSAAPRKKASVPAAAQGPISNDAQLWEWYRAKGLTPDQATLHVQRMRDATSQNIPQEYLKDIDPGGLATFGLGMADMMSFGVGKQIAGAIDTQVPVPKGVGGGTQAASRLAEQAGGQLHGGAHLAGEIAGAVLPGIGAAGLAKTGLIGAYEAPALYKAAAGVASTPLRAAAKTGVNALMGAGFGALSAAGHTEGGIEPRLEAAKGALIPGAVVGATLPWVVAGLGAGGSKMFGGMAKRVAGPGPAVAAETAAPAAAEATAANPQAALRQQLLQAGVLPENVDAQLARQMRTAAPTPTPEPDLTEATFLRRNSPVPSAAPVRPYGKPFVEPTVTPAGELPSSPVPREPFVSPSVQGLGRSSAAGSPMYTSPASPEQRAAIQQLIVRDLLGGGQAAEAPSALSGMGRGTTLPYYPRGGQVEQSMAPLPMVSRAMPGMPPNALQTSADLARSLGQMDPQFARAELARLIEQYPAEAQAAGLAPSARGGLPRYAR